MRPPPRSAVTRTVIVATPSARMDRHDKRGGRQPEVLLLLFWGPCMGPNRGHGIVPMSQRGEF